MNAECPRLICPVCPVSSISPSPAMAQIRTLVTSPKKKLSIRNGSAIIATSSAA